MYSSSVTSMVMPLFLKVTLCVFAIFSYEEGPDPDSRDRGLFKLSDLYSSLASKSSGGAPQTGHSSGGWTPSISSPQTVHVMVTVIGGGGGAPASASFFSPVLRGGAAVENFPV